MSTAKKIEGKQEKVIVISQEVLYKLRMKYERATVTDFGAVSNSIERTLDEYIEANDKKPPTRQLSMMAGVLDMVAENIEREAEERENRNRSAAEWRQLEYEFARVSTGAYSMHTLEHIVSPERFAKYKECGHRFCINGFLPRRKNEVYCAPSCKKAEEYAVMQFKKTSKEFANGTYLPVYAYKTVRGKQAEQQYMAHELLFEPFTLSQIAAQRELSAVEGAKPRDRGLEERKNKAHQLEKAVAYAESVKPSAVITTKMQPEELEEKYGAEKLRHERKRARIFGINKA